MRQKNNRLAKQLKFYKKQLNDINQIHRELEINFINGEIWYCLELLNNHIIIYNFFKNRCKHKFLSKNDTVLNREYKNQRNKWVQILERSLLSWKKFPNQPYRRSQILGWYEIKYRFLCEKDYKFSMIKNMIEKKIK